jgi:hypothetical protein
MKEKLSRIRSPWRRRWITFVIHACLFAGRFAFPRPRARIHWVGHVRPRRLERLLIFVLLLAAALILEQDEYLMWVTVWGALFSLGINLYLGYKLLRRRAHWI